MSRALLHLIPAALLILAPTTAKGVTTTSATAQGEAPAKLADSIMKGIAAGNVKTTLEVAMPDVLKANPMQFNNLVSQVETALSTYGPMTGWVLVSSEAIGTSLQRRIYVSQHDLSPLVWTTVLFRSSSGWKVENFKFGDKASELFD